MIHDKLDQCIIVKENYDYVDYEMQMIGNAKE